MAVVTSGAGEVEREKAVAIGVAELVECVVVSEEVGVMKLDGSGRIFEVAMERMGVERGEFVCYVVGESVEADVEGALRSGLTPVLFNPEGEKRERVGDVTCICRMTELLEFFGIDRIGL
jgi:putative hydrolase of the HAD superfamily